MSKDIKFAGTLSYRAVVDGKQLEKGDRVYGNLVIDTDNGRHYITERIYWSDDYYDGDCEDAQLYHGVEHDDDKTAIVIDGYEITISHIRAIAEAERNGRLVVLPCKVGDKIYTISTDGSGNIDSDEIREETVYEFYVHQSGVGISIDPYDGHIGNYTREGCDTGTQKIYLDKANAEAALSAGKEDESNE